MLRYHLANGSFVDADLIFSLVALVWLKFEIIEAVRRIN